MPKKPQKVVDAQQALNELFSEQLIPFELFARKIDPISHDEYVVRFHDSRLRSVDLSWSQGENFKEIFRAAVLERVKRLSGPLYGKAASVVKRTKKT